MFFDFLATPISLITVISAIAFPTATALDTTEYTATQNRIETVIQAPTDTDIQSFTTDSETPAIELERDGYNVLYTPPPAPEPEPEPVKVETKSTESSKKSYTAPNVTPDPGSAQAEAWNQVQAYGWGQEEFNCLVALWNRESGWRVNALNQGSGAYGIPQSLPGSKMASAGSDWETNPATQIRWGLNYISGRYSSPCGAWSHSENFGWY